MPGARLEARREGFGLWGIALRLRYTRLVEIRWTEWSEDHIGRHGVTAQEVDEAVSGRPILLRRGRDGATCLYGRTGGGRYLMVVVVADPDPESTMFVVSAREMTEREKRTFRQRTG